MIIDVHDPRIERDVGDPWGRQPHFTVDDTKPSSPGVLYVPSRTGFWNAKVLRTVDDAAAWLKRTEAKPSSLDSDP